MHIRMKSDNVIATRIRQKNTSERNGKENRGSLSELFPTRKKNSMLMSLISIAGRSERGRNNMLLFFLEVFNLIMFSDDVAAPAISTFVLFTLYLICFH